MTDIARIRRLIQAFNFDALFEELGWDRFNRNLPIVVDEVQYALTGVREKRGFQVFHYLVPKGDAFPNAATMTKIQRAVAKTAHENIVIFSDEAQTRQCFRIARREEGKLLRSTGLDFYQGHSGEGLAQRISKLAITLEEEEDLSIIDVANRASELYAERVTKKFFTKFQQQRDAFKDFIKGIKDIQQQEWYASLMLNRLMFVYFVQKKGFLDRDRDYLKNRLAQSREANKDFHSFYQYFLLRLFHDGLNKREADRDPELEKLLGEVPYLNGGIFGEHQIELNKKNKIKIADEAFENLFNFFDEYTWHLDDRPLRDDTEINPDVLGYIFEKYINQKQMGAYYTKEDITEYISKNTILPYLFDEAARRNTEPFRPEREVWQLLCDDPDRYIYNAVGHGVFINSHTGEELKKPAPLPANIKAGVKDVAKRTDWNTAAPEEVALSTETWREHIARRQRCKELQKKLSSGGVTSINDLITYNLDIRQFAQDVIDNCESADLLRAIYYTIAGRPEQLGSNHKAQLPLSVLDPTCGSGAFLFAALNILQPLYEACLTRMEQFVADSDQSQPITVDDEVAALIELGESNTVEFKSTARLDVKAFRALADKPEGQRLEILKKKDQDRQHDILKAVSALLNTKGGDLVIGVEDDGVGFGVHHDYIFLGSEAKRNRDNYELWLNQLFINQFGKVAAGCIEPVFAQRDGVDVVWLKISPSPDPAMVKKQDGSEVFYRRIGNSSQSLDMTEFAKYHEQRFKGDPPPRKEPKLKIGKATKTAGKKFKDFREILAEVEKHPNRTYFVLKSVIINNLFGVDIMPEAVEICKLRLFLKLMSTVEPHYARDNLGVEALPDIDFNIRTGNTLVGYATLEEIEKTLSQTLGFEQDQLTAIQKQVKIVALQFELFRRQQTELDSHIKEEDKIALRAELATLTHELDEFLAGDYGVDANKPKKFSEWKDSHQPFHWFAEFFAIVQHGGFNVIIGNPPYIENRQVTDYQLHGFNCKQAGNLYAIVVERCDRLADATSHLGFIVPVSSISTDRYACLQELLCTHDLFYSSFDDRPSRLFDGLQHIRLTIHLLGKRRADKSHSMYSTRYNKWNAVARDTLFDTLEFSTASQEIVANTLPKLSSVEETRIVSALLNQRAQVSDFYARSGTHQIFYSRKVGYFLQVLDFEPRVLDGHGELRPPSEFKTLKFGNAVHAQLALGALNSTLFYWFITVFSDCRHLNKREVDAFPLDLELLAESKHGKKICDFSSELMKDIDKNSEERVMRFRHDTLTVQCIIPRHSKPIIDAIDRELAEYLGLAATDFDFVRAYDLKFRIGVDSPND